MTPLTDAEIELFTQALRLACLLVLLRMIHVSIDARPC
jgi:hypothetical protein